MSTQLTLVLSEENVSPAAVWEMLPTGVRSKVTVMLARLLAMMVEETRDD
jgi:hypothetical protein